MVGSDTKLMPCHTGCQQISQWITPQPLDVHRAKGHKHGRGEVEGGNIEATNKLRGEKKVKQTEIYPRLMRYLTEIKSP